MIVNNTKLFIFCCNWLYCLLHNKVHTILDKTSRFDHAYSIFIGKLSIFDVSVVGVQCCPPCSDEVTAPLRKPSDVFSDITISIIFLRRRLKQCIVKNINVHELYASSFPWWDVVKINLSTLSFVQLCPVGLLTGTCQVNIWHLFMHLKQLRNEELRPWAKMSTPVIKLTYFAICMYTACLHCISKKKKVNVGWIQWIWSLMGNRNFWGVTWGTLCIFRFIYFIFSLLETNHCSKIVQYNLWARMIIRQTGKRLHFWWA